MASNVAYRKVRRVLLFAFIAFVGAVIGLYIFGRVDRNPSPQDSGSAGEYRDQDRELVLVGEGYSHEVTEGEQRLFGIQADRILSDREGTIILEGVTIDTDRDDGTSYRITGDKGTFEIESKVADLEGNVRIRSESTDKENPTTDRSAELFADGLRLEKKGRIIVSSSPVRFTFGALFSGSANAMRVDLRKNIFHLAGDVEIVRGVELPGEAPATLTCRQLIFEREDRTIRAEGSVRLIHGDDALATRRLSVLLGPDEKEVQFVHAQWNVVGSFIKRERVTSLEPALEEGSTLPPTAEDTALADPELPAIESMIRFRGRTLAVAFEEATKSPESAELTGTSKESAVLIREIPEGKTSELQAREIIADFNAGDLERAQAIVDVVVIQRLSDRTGKWRRTVTADEADARFGGPGGEDVLVMRGGVELEEGNRRGGGEEATLYLDRSGESTLTGDLAWLEAEDGKVEAPKIYQAAGEDKVRATGGVRGRFLEGVELLGGRRKRAVPEAERPPVWIEAEDAEWSSADMTYSFEGKVRIWQGEDLLLADKVIAASEGGKLDAFGSVKTIWRRPPEDTEQADPDLPDEPDPEPIEINSLAMSFDRSNRKIRYEGEAHAYQGGRDLQGDQIEADLSEEDEIERIRCIGNVRLRDPVAGRSVVGDVAVYDPALQVVTVTGNKVVMKDQDGARLEGNVLVYDMAAGTTQITVLERPTDEKEDPVLDPVETDLLETDSESVDENDSAEPEPSTP